MTALILAAQERDSSIAFYTEKLCFEKLFAVEGPIEGSHGIQLDTLRQDSWRCSKAGDFVK
jgi:hypothetical protein